MAAPSPDAGTDQPDAPVADRAVEAADTAAATPPTDIAAEPAEASPAAVAPASDTAVPAEDTLPPETQDAAPPEAEAEGAPVVAEAEAVPEPPRPIFADLGLSDPVLRAIADMGYRHPTPIQEQAIPYVLMGRDVLGVAQTGTGKTASFTLPMLDILAGSRARARMPRSLILEPTRELALQVAENFVMYGKYLKLTHALIIAGESMSDQKDVLI
ncbi:MAG: DEAD/DEAH box helicase, partial [Rhodospirillales bacterium]|nr:DEAD/DEAH box helicase [Rhodospirillales bacterium]